MKQRSTSHHPSWNNKAATSSTSTSRSRLLLLLSSSLKSLENSNQENSNSNDTSNTIDERLLIQQLESCKTGTAACRILNKALSIPNDDKERRQQQSTPSPLFGSVTIPRGLSDRIISDSDLSIQTRMSSRNNKHTIFDLNDTSGNRDADRVSASVLLLFVTSSISALYASENVPGPEIVRFIIVWGLTFAPFVLLGYSITKGDQLSARLVALQRQLFPVYRKRMIQHEAGHFLLAHLLGIPIAGYSTSTKACVQFYPFNDQDVGTERAKLLGFDRPTSRKEDEDEEVVTRADRPYYSDDGKGSDIITEFSVFRNAKNYTDNPFLKMGGGASSVTANSINPKKSWPYRGFDHDTIDKLCIVSVAGICSEIMALGNAEGGNADMVQLQQIFSNAEPELTDKEKENRIRFAMGYTMSQLRLHLGCIDSLVDVMDNGGTLAQCVLAIEKCDNRSGNDNKSDNNILNKYDGSNYGSNNYNSNTDYDYRRRQKLKSELGFFASLGIFQKFLFGPNNLDDGNIDDNSDEQGGVLSNIQISGDDPLYLALGVACLFIAWATNGGLSLH